MDSLETTLDKVKEGLADRNITAVSKNTGLSAQTLARYKAGTEKKPKFSTLYILRNYLGIK